MGVGGVLADTGGITAIYYLGGALLVTAAAIDLTKLRRADLHQQPVRP